VKQFHVFTVLVALLVVAVLVLYAFTFQVRETEAAVLTTFGKLPEDARPLPPGWHFRWTGLVQQVFRYDRRLQVYEDALDEVSTKDRKPVLLNCYVGWRVTDAVTFYNRGYRNEREAESTIGQVLRSEKAAVVGRHLFSDLVALRDPAEETAPRFDAIEAAIRRNVQETLTGYGIDVVVVGIKRLELPASATKAVFERMIEDRKRESERYRAEGLAEAGKIEAKTSLIRETARQKARADATAIEAAADAEAAAYYKEFARNPELAVLLRKLAALRVILRKRSTVVLDGNTPPFDVFERPMEHIEKASREKR
jgi:membrane protease subunit HflC